MKHAQVGLFLLTITASGLALANCPGSMPDSYWKTALYMKALGLINRPVIKHKWTSTRLAEDAATASNSSTDHSSYTKD